MQKLLQLDNVQIVRDSYVQHEIVIKTVHFNTVNVNKLNTNERPLCSIIMDIFTTVLLKSAFYFPLILHIL